MPQRTNLLSATLAILSLLILLSSVWYTGKSGLASQDNPSGFSCRVFCSDAELRTSIAELSWRADDLAVDLAQQVLEVTVFKDGFQRGIKARLTPIQNGQQFIVTGPGGQPQQATPGLDRLVLAGVQTLPDGRIQVRVKGLEAGLNYLWRLQSLDGSTALTGTARCESPVCPADEVRGAN